MPNTTLAASLLEDKPDPGSFVFMEISDNGCGMNEDTLKRLFDPFFTTKFTGRGLGMSAVMGIMRVHYGALFVESEPGKGTTFRALFPVVKPTLEAPPQFPLRPVLAPLAGTPLESGCIKNPPEKSTSPERPLAGVVLVVDDEKPVLKVCSKMVNLCGFTVITARDGIDAVASFREHADEVVLVLMDLTMPNMDGITAMGEIFSIRPDVKVILSSGFSEEELTERVGGCHPSGYICKPYSMNALETEMRRVMQGN